MDENNTVNQLSFYKAGIENRSAGQSWTSIRDLVLFYYTISGTGLIRRGLNEWRLGVGEGFVVFPGDLIEFAADGDCPWRYFWMGLSGGLEESVFSSFGLTRGDPVFISNSPEKLASGLEKEAARVTSIQSRFQGLEFCYKILGLLEKYGVQGQTKEFSPYHQNYIDAELAFIKANYHRPTCTVAAIASRLGLSRGYLSLLTRRETGKTPREHLFAYRMYKAQELLSFRDESIAMVAKEVGYRDPMTFSKAFRHWMGLAPLQYRNKTKATKRLKA